MFGLGVVEAGLGPEVIEAEIIGNNGQWTVLGKLTFYMNYLFINFKMFTVHRSSVTKFVQLTLTKIMNAFLSAAFRCNTAVCNTALSFHASQRYHTCQA